MTSAPRPLDGVRVVEFSHMVMGPTCGLVLADLGADVVKVEPAPGGDKTRSLPGSGSGYFGTYNRNKQRTSKLDSWRKICSPGAPPSENLKDNLI